MHPHSNVQTILVGEDELEVRAYLEMALKCLGYSVELAQNREEILTCLRSQANISAVLLDILLPDSDGLDVLRDIHNVAPNVPVIVVSGAASTLNVVSAMKFGAADFLEKPVSHDELGVALARALEIKKPAFSSAGAPQPSTKTNVFFGSSPKMQEIRSLIGKVGWSEAPVLIQGETGTGKEVLARELHANSPRAAKVFLKLNCAALPSELVESELFGYERGAFTGAFQKKIGMFEAADGGTILLDEIGDMEVRLQAKLLQVLQDREFQRVGGRETVKVDVRVMAATHRDLELAIDERAFREDLYYRLNVINIQLPPLRERNEDIVRLAEHLLAKHTIPGKSVALTPKLKQALIAYDWPGNVRELENVIRKLTVLRVPDLIARELLEKTARRTLPVAQSAPISIRAGGTGHTAEKPILEQVIKAKEQAESQAILSALNSTRWNRKQAAVLLKIDYKALLYKMKKLGLDDDAAPTAAVDSEENGPRRSARERETEESTGNAS
jgi:two-component system response regulator AtoC